jgi:DNA-binding response OmpR family regulator
VGKYGRARVAMAADTHDAAPARGPILIVEDDPSIRSVLREALELAGLEVEAAPDGWQALALALARPPALVILDLNLDRLDGEDVATGLLRLETIDTPVIVVSGDAHAARRARELGAFAHLAKPFDVDQLLAVVRRGLARGPR